MIAYTFFLDRKDDKEFVYKIKDDCTEDERIQTAIKAGGWIDFPGEKVQYRLNLNKLKMICREFFDEAEAVPDKEAAAT